jgi:hypothetical protein
MKTTNTQNVKEAALRGRSALAEALTTGTKVTALNENPVCVKVIELAPFLKVKKPSRSSTFYDKIE